MPLLAARAAAVLVSLPGALPDRSGFRRRGREGLDRFLRGVPREHLDAVRSRLDVKETMEKLEYVGDFGRGLGE